MTIYQKGALGAIAGGRRAGEEGFWGVRAEDGERRKSLKGVGKRQENLREIAKQSSFFVLHSSAFRPPFLSS